MLLVHVVSNGRTSLLCGVGCVVMVCVEMVVVMCYGV